MDQAPFLTQPRAKGHGRITSTDERRRVAIPRRSTLDDPLGATSPSSESAPAVSPAPSASSHRQQLQQQQPLTSPTSIASPTSAIDDLPAKDLSFLRDPTIYHALPANEIPSPFLTSPQQPPLTTPLGTLLSMGHFRAAAVSCARSLATAAPSTSHTQVLELFHIRLACLCLLGQHVLAAAEAKALGDLSSAFYRHPLSNEHIVPWELRVLVVRLAALGYGEWRKGIMGFYELAREAREKVIKATTAEQKQLWRSRLRDLGVRVANLMIEMGDLEGAGRHLESLGTAKHGDGVEMRNAKAMETLVWLRVGDVQAAKRCLAAASTAETADDDASSAPVLQALVKMAEGDLSGAADAWLALHETSPEDAMVSQNLALCLLYTGRLPEARTTLESLVDSGCSFHALTFNLSTIYELCTEKARERKLQLAERVAAHTPGEAGWEKLAADFKL